MLTSCGGNGSKFRFLVRHGIRHADYYNRLEPASLIHLVWSNPDLLPCDIGGNSVSFSGASCGSPQLFLVPSPQGYDTLLPNTQPQRKGTG
jgi:hypothetical protein